MRSDSRRLGDKCKVTLRHTYRCPGCSHRFSRSRTAKWVWDNERLMYNEKDFTTMMMTDLYDELAEQKCPKCETLSTGRHTKVKK